MNRKYSQTIDIADENNQRKNLPESRHLEYRSENVKTIYFSQSPINDLIYSR